MVLDFQSIHRKFSNCAVLLSSGPRGGSTFANEAIGIHPEILWVPWNDKTLHRTWNKRNTNNTTFRNFLLREPDYFDREAAIKILGSRNLELFERYVDFVCSRRKLEEIYCLHGILYWIMSGMEMPLDKMKLWVNKANTFRNMISLQQALPSCRFVVMQRDPRPVTLSLAKVRAERKRFSDVDVVCGAIDWTRQAVGYAEFLEKCKNTSLLIRYEDLVCNNVDTLNNVYQFLGLDAMYRDEIIQRMKHVYFKRTGSIYDQEFGAENPRPSGIQREGLLRWKKQLDSAQITLIDRLTQKHAEFYGYNISSQSSMTLRACFKRIPSLGLRVKQLARYLDAKVRFASLRH